MTTTAVITMTGTNEMFGVEAIYDSTGSVSIVGADGALMTMSLVSAALLSKSLQNAALLGLECVKEAIEGG